MYPFAAKLAVAITIILIAIVLSVHLPPQPPEPSALPAYAHPTSTHPYVDESPSASDLVPAGVADP